MLVGMTPTARASLPIVHYEVRKFHTKQLHIGPRTVGVLGNIQTEAKCSVTLLSEEEKNG